MILKQQQTPIYGNADIWQVLLEYEHTGKKPAALTGYRIEWQSGVVAERMVGKAVPVEVVLFSGDKRQVLDHVAEAAGRRCKHERAFKSALTVQHGEQVQVRAKFPCPLPLAQVVLF
jgi:hypothetical protein